jgi:hypothetical protein|tara:strand:- start:840 stop:1454 length:615 start_codon:yes stop_codon:yes gene_type:complete
MAVISNATTIIDAGAISVAKGALTHIKTLTASSSGTLTFHHGTSDVILDSTYKHYMFEFINIHPSSNDSYFTFQANAVGESGFNETITSSMFRAYNKEDSSANALAYENGDYDLDQETVFQVLNDSVGTDTDQSTCGRLMIFEPSSTVFVKHWAYQGVENAQDNKVQNTHTTGYFNTTAALDEFQFKMNTGNMDTGSIKLYGIS